MSEATINLPATQGQMGSTVFYTATMSLGEVVKFLTYDPEKMLGLDPEERTQRALQAKRIPEIAEYLVDSDDWIFSSLTVSVIGDLAFDPVRAGSKLGTLKLPSRAEFTVNDGQHRAAGIAEALLRKPELADSDISVVIIPGTDTRRSQQIFSDLNRTVLKTSRSLDILFDHRAPINQLTVQLADSVPLFKGRIDKERVALSGRAHDFTTLAGLQAATQNLLGPLSASVSLRERRELLREARAFWEALTGIVEPYAAIASGDLRPDHARQDFVSVYSLVLHGLGAVGGTLRKQLGAGDYLRKLEELRAVDWRKSNPEWQGICMVGSEVVTRGPARKATAQLIHHKLGLAAKPRAVLGKQSARKK